MKAYYRDQKTGKMLTEEAKEIADMIDEAIEFLERKCEEIRNGSQHSL